MSFRDLVSGGGCHGGNGVSRFVDGFQKSSRFGFDAYRANAEVIQHNDGPGFQEMLHESGGAMFMPPEMGMPHEMVAGGGGWESEFQDFRPPQENFDDLRSVFDGISANVQQQDMIVGSTLRNFFRGLMTNMRPGVMLPDLAFGALQLTHEDKSKIRDRSLTLARHFLPADPGMLIQAESQLQHLFDSLRIEDSARMALHESLEADRWAEEFSQHSAQAIPATSELEEAQFREVWERESMERAWQETRPARLYNETVSGWASQFERDQDKYEVKLSESELKQFQETYDKVADQGEEWAQEFREQMTNEDLEEEEWFSQFLPGGKFTTPVMTANSWANEFQAQHSSSSSSSSAWANEFESFQPNHPGETLRIPTTPQFEELSNLVSQIPNPKLQNSRFMQFIRQVNDGEVQLPENPNSNPNPNMNQNNPSSVADSWAREFRP